MAHLGDFGCEHEPSDATFGYFGATLRVHPDLSDIVWLTLADEMEAADGEHAALRLIVSTLVHPDDVAEFWRLARANRQTLDDLQKFGIGMLSALTARPTERPSDFSDGPPPMQDSSATASVPALHLLKGRPDLQVAVLQAQEARSA